MKRMKAICGGCLLVSVLLMQARLFATDMNFSSPSHFSVSPGPVAVAIADFNGDGKPDIVSASYSGDNVSVLLGTGSGNFGAATTFAVGDGPHSMAVGDFNGDGRSDLVTANENGDNVSILLGSGTGSLGPATNFAVGDFPFSIAVGDFNRDGKLDLVTANAGSSDVSILLGNGVGGFGPATSFSTGSPSSPSSVVVGDFNSDGRLDLATANYYDVAVLLGDGAGGFGTRTNFTSHVAPYFIATCDFNSDGKLDLIVTGSYYNSVEVLLGGGAGDFSVTPRRYLNSWVESLVVKDLNGDGRDDLAVPYFYSYNEGIDVLLGDGADGFLDPPYYHLSPLGGAIGLAAGDLNGDGKPDLVSANFSSMSVTVLLNTTPVESIVFEPLPNKNFGDAPFRLNATSTSGLPVNFSVVRGPATVAGNMLTLTGVGQVTVRASLPGKGFVVAATVDRSLTVFKGTPAITWPTPADIPSGTALSTAQLNARAGVPGTLTYSPPSGTVLPRGGNQPLTVSFLPADTANYLPASATVRINVVNAAPHVTSAPTAMPNPATAGVPVTFSAAAGDSDNDALTYTWALGDSATREGATATYTYAAAGTYSVVVTIDDGHGGRTSASLTLEVRASYGKDSDQDGFTDAIEIAAGSSPFNASETPTGAAARPLPLTDARLSIKLNFARSGNDQVSLSGSVFQADGFDTTGAALMIDIGGVAGSFALGATGSVRSGNDIATVKSKGAGSSTVRFSIKMSKGDFAAILNSAGLIDAEVSKEVNVPITLIIAGKMFQRQQQQVYKARAHKTGATKDKR